MHTLALSRRISTRIASFDNLSPTMDVEFCSGGVENFIAIAIPKSRKHLRSFESW